MPRYTRWNYSKTYLKHVRKFYQDRMDEKTTIQFNANSFTVSDSHGESVISYNELEQINELANYCFLKLKSGQSIILPSYQVENSEHILMQLTSIAHDKSIEWKYEREWTWK
jgi:hypothetical protein